LHSEDYRGDTAVEWLRIHKLLKSLNSFWVELLEIFRFIGKGLCLNLSICKQNPLCNNINQFASLTMLAIILQIITKSGGAVHDRITIAALDFADQPRIAGTQRTERMSEIGCLVEREIPRLRRYARALTRATDRADDLVQDTLVRALTKGHLWQPGTDIRAWLLAIMHNQYVNTVRREVHRAATIDIEQVTSTLVAATDPTSSPAVRARSRARPPARRAT
jgi:Sigma2 domain of PhyR